MPDVPDAKAAVDILAVGRTGISIVPVQVFVDGTRSGRLKGTLATSFPVSAGEHKVRVKCGYLRSQTLDLSLSPGERAALECGFERRLAPLYLGVILLQAAILPGLFNLPLTGGAVICLGVVVLAIVEWKTFVAPGGYLYVRRRSALADTGSIPPLPRMAIWQWMLVVAVAAVLLAIGVQERATQRQAQYLSLARLHQRTAEFHTDNERFWKQSVQQLTRIEVAERNYIDAISAVITHKNDDDDLKSQLQFQQRSIAQTRSMLAWYTQLAAFHAGLKEKYLRAAALPWEPVGVDPPPPRLLTPQSAPKSEPVDED